jgi:hypothetical protein
MRFDIDFSLMDLWLQNCMSQGCHIVMTLSIAIRQKCARQARVSARMRSRCLGRPDRPAGQTLHLRVSHRNIP